MKGKFDWRSVYFHIVSLVAMITLLVAAVSCGHGILTTAFPLLSIDKYEWRQVESFTAFKGQTVSARAEGGPATAPGDSVVPSTTPDETKLRAVWEENRHLVIEGQRRRGLWMVLQSLVTIVVVVPIYWWHRRGAKRLPQPVPGED
jgi:hypothetical protein